MGDSVPNIPPGTTVRPSRIVARRCTNPVEVEAEDRGLYWLHQEIFITHVSHTRHAVSSNRSQGPIRTKGGKFHCENGRVISAHTVGEHCDTCYFRSVQHVDAIACLYNRKKLSHPMFIAEEAWKCVELV